MPGSVSPATLPAPVLARLDRAADAPPFRGVAQDLLKTVSALDAFPIQPRASLGLAEVYLAVGQAELAETWGQIATDQLAAAGAVAEALRGQVVVARAQVRRQQLAQAREVLRDVAMSTDHLFDLDAAPTAAMTLLRGAFALAAAEIRLEARELGDAVPLYLDALEDLEDPAAAALRVAALQGLGVIALLSLDTAAAIPRFREAAKLAASNLATAEELELDLALVNQLLAAGELVQAERLATRCKERATLQKNGPMIAAFSGALAQVATWSGDGAGAVDSGLDAMEAFAAAGDPWGYTQMLTLVANGHLRQERPGEAASTLIAGAAALRAQGLSLHAELLQIQLEDLRAHLGVDAFEALTGALLAEWDGLRSPGEAP